MEKIKELLKKVLTREVILYIIFGVLTTLINLGSFYIMFEILHWNENTSNMIAIILAVLFAYITNKDLVFHSKAGNAKEKLIEFWKGYRKYESKVDSRMSQIIKEFYKQDSQVIVLPHGGEMGKQEYEFAKPNLAGLYKIHNTDSSSYATI